MSKTTYTASFNGLPYRPTSDSLEGAVREVSRILTENGHTITFEDLVTEQAGPDTWHVILFSPVSAALSRQVAVVTATEDAS